MTLTINQARERHGRAQRRATALLERSKDRPMTVEEVDAFDSSLDEMADLRSRIVQAEVDNRREAYRDAFGTYLRRGEDHLKPEQREVLLERRAQSEATNSAGGFLVPQDFWRNVTVQLKQFGGIMNEATLVPTEEGHALPWPKTNDTANAGFILGENVQITETDFTFGSTTLNAYNYVSGEIIASRQVTQDSAFNLDEWLAEQLAIRIGRAAAAHFATGTGTGQPTGLGTAPTVGVTGATGQTTTVTYDNLVDLAHSVDPAYRQLGNCKFVMNDTTLTAIRHLKDSQGHPIFLAENPDEILGYPIVIDNALPSMAANALSILFGDIRRAYVVRQVQGAYVHRLDERYADFLQVAWIASIRMDGQPADAAAIRAYKNSAT